MHPSSISMNTCLFGTSCLHEVWYSISAEWTCLAKYCQTCTLYCRFFFIAKATLAEPNHNNSTLVRCPSQSLAESYFAIFLVMFSPYKNCLALRYYSNVVVTDCWLWSAICSTTTGKTRVEVVVNGERTGLNTHRKLFDQTNAVVFGRLVTYHDRCGHSEKTAALQNFGWVFLRFARWLLWSTQRGDGANLTFIHTTIITLSMNLLYSLQDF